MINTWVVRERRPAHGQARKKPK